MWFVYLPYSTSVSVCGVCLTYGNICVVGRFLKMVE